MNDMTDIFCKGSLRLGTGCTWCRKCMREARELGDENRRLRNQLAMITQLKNNLEDELAGRMHSHADVLRALTA